MRLNSIANFDIRCLLNVTSNQLRVSRILGNHWSRAVVHWLLQTESSRQVWCV